MKLGCAQKSSVGFDAEHPVNGINTGVKKKITVAKKKNTGVKKKNRKAVVHKPPTDIETSHYIPLGTLLCTIDESVTYATQWTELDPSIFNLGVLPVQTHSQLSYDEFYALLLTDWIKSWVQADVNNPRSGTLRIAVLPDDVGRKFVPRSDGKLRAILMKMMETIDGSSESWHCGCSSTRPAELYKFTPTEEDSLFYIYNTLKSPEPNPAKIKDIYAREAAEGLRDGSTIVSGLKTELHLYQRRSAAQMIERETQPARMRDPRLEAYKGPTGRDFYFNRLRCHLLAESPTYDETRGGILAETMGYGKTLICLTVIHQTKDYWPRPPPIVVEKETQPIVRSLLDMAAAAVRRSSIPWRWHFDRLFEKTGEDYQNCIKAIEKTDPTYRFDDPKFDRRFSMRNARDSGPVQITRTLTSTTIIIVPDNLMSQWLNEIDYHFERGSFKVLEIGKEVPPPEVLRTYDIILISASNLAREARPHEIHAMDCRYHSPLMDVHFLRLIVDEGHKFAVSGNMLRANYVLGNLVAERIWIVSGTPTRNLLGVEVEMAAISNLNSQHSFGREASNHVDLGFIKPDVQAVLEGRRKEKALMQETEDIERLGHIVVDLLRQEPWKSAETDGPNWNQAMKPAIKGERNMLTLRTTLESLVVRHRIEDIDADIRLPPLYNRVVSLEPCFHDRLSLNLFVSTLKVNAVTSERADQDYMFHQSNRKELNKLLKNLRHSGFYWTGISELDVENLLEISQRYAAKARDRISGDDGILLLTATKMAATALSSVAWKAFSSQSEMGLFVANFPLGARQHWALCKEETEDILILGATQLHSAQKAVNQVLYAPNPLETLAAPYVDVMSNQNGNPARRDSNDFLKTACPDIKLKLKLLDGHNRGNNRLKSAMKEPAVQSSRLPKGNDNDVDGPLKAVKLVGTASAKLSYLIDRITILEKSEKILVFYEGDHIAWCIAQAMDILSVQHLIYPSKLSLERRAQYIRTFQHRSEIRVLLMDLAHAAHGLHIAAASRVFFVNPVWQPSVEAQAIKRAHRIGQTRPVYVETLVLRHSLEEKMLERRMAMTTQEHQQAEASPLNDSTVADLVMNASFLPLSDVAFDTSSSRMARLSNSLQVFGRGTPVSDDIFDLPPVPTEILQLSTETPRLKRKARFADETSDEVTNGTIPSPKRPKIHLPDPETTNYIDYLAASDNSNNPAPNIN